MAADTSMLLRKPLGEIAHEGGLRLRRGTKTHEYLRDWIAEGAKDDPAAPAAVALEIMPGARLLNDARHHAAGRRRGEVCGRQHHAT